MIDENVSDVEKEIKKEISFSSSGSENIGSKAVFTPESLDKAWLEFTEQMDGEGTRITSMFKSVKPEMENNQTIRIHLSNATQKDTFVQYYKQKLISFLERRLILQDIDIETIVDITETNEIIYSDEQKYNYLFNKYPIMKDIKKTFNLDIN
jgi:DNA polymerase-3 subunit gamma/tau